MIERQDGSFSDIKELGEIAEQFFEEVEEDTSLEETPAALHVGSEEELKAKRREKDTEERLDELESEVERLRALAEKAASPRGSRRVAVPSPEEVARVSDDSIIK